MKKPVIDRNRPLGLYLHIPFCKAKCAYCDFYSLPHSEEKMDAYAAALAPGGDLVMSGFLEQDVPAITEAAAKLGMTVAATADRDGWMLVHVKKES